MTVADALDWLMGSEPPTDASARRAMTILVTTLRSQLLQSTTPAGVQGSLEALAAMGITHDGLGLARMRCVPQFMAMHIEFRRLKHWANT